MSRMQPLAMAISATLLVGMLADDANAGDRLPPQRYAACPDRPPRRRVQNNAAQTNPPDKPLSDDDLLPMPRRHPRRAAAAPRQEIDIVHWHPIPNAPPAAPGSPAIAPPQPPARVLAQRGLDFYCVGFDRGKNGILEVLAAPPGRRYRGRSDWLAVNIAAAAMFNQREAIPWLKRQLKRPSVATASGYQQWRRRREHLNAMRALAEFQVHETSVDQAALAFVRQLETDSPSMWRDSLESFRRLSPQTAQKYAIERLRAGRSGGSLQPLTDVAQRLLNQPSHEAQQAISKNTSPLRSLRSDRERSANCHLLAARVRMGDSALRRELTSELGQGLRSLRATVCFSKIFEPVFPSDEADSIDAYILRAKYQLMVHWVAELNRRKRTGKLAAKWRDAEQRLRQAIPKIMARTQISGGRRHRDYAAEQHGRVLLIRQALGERIRARQLDEVIAADSRHMARWTMALDGLTLSLSHAADRAAAALHWGIEHSGSRIYPRFDRRGGHVIEEQGRLVEALAKHGDPRFVLGLLQASAHPYSVTLTHMSRRRPQGACRIVTQAAHKARQQVVERAFWALSLYGKSCEKPFLRIAGDDAQPAHVVSMAIEMLAMQRSKKTLGLLEGIKKPRSDHRRRVELILKAATAPPPRQIP